MELVTNSNGRYHGHVEREDEGVENLDFDVNACMTEGNSVLKKETSEETVSSMGIIAAQIR
jgi:hypothetical protein